MNFIISGFVLSLIFNCLWIIAIIGSEMKVITKWLSSLALIVVCTFAFAGMFYLTNKEWNNGVCVNCGDKYQAISYYKGSTHYECPSCHKTVDK